jgi:hypothetical protein
MRTNRSRGCAGKARRQESSKLPSHADIVGAEQQGRGEVAGQHLNHGCGAELFRFLGPRGKVVGAGGRRISREESSRNGWDGLMYKVRKKWMVGQRRR